MIQEIILEELECINQLLDLCLYRMKDILGSKPRDFLWRMFFPAGQFMQRKSIARKTSYELLKLDTRLREMEQVLEEREHPVKPQISKILDTDLVMMSSRLVDLPERAQYMISQIENIKFTIENVIRDSKLN